MKTDGAMDRGVLRNSDGMIYRRMKHQTPKSKHQRNPKQPIPSEVRPGTRLSQSAPRASPGRLSGSASAPGRNVLGFGVWSLGFGDCPAHRFNRTTSSWSAAATGSSVASPSDHPFFL